LTSRIGTSLGRTHALWPAVPSATGSGRLTFPGLTKCFFTGLRARGGMQRKLLDILACPIDKHYPLDMLEFNVRGEDVIVDGVLMCSKCGRYYPIMDEIPVMLPDNLRNKKEDIGFLEKWSTKLPEKVTHGGKPWSL
jgi:uncharacterized protein